jgi:hypothetical protein
MLVVFTAGIDVWPASYAIGSEASALRLRSKAQGIGWFMYGLGTMVFGVAMPYFYNPDAANIDSFRICVLRLRQPGSCGNILLRTRDERPLRKRD